jgi:hypothetical protein
MRISRECWFAKLDVDGPVAVLTLNRPPAANTLREGSVHARALSARPVGELARRFNEAGQLPLSGPTSVK